MLCKVLAGTWD